MVSPARKRWTVATGVTALFGAVAACTTYGSEPDVVPPNPATPLVEAGTDASEVDAGACRAGTVLSSDPKNCGACGHDCLGAACTDGSCGIVEIATSLSQPRYVRAQGDDLFVLTADAVLRAPKAGGQVQSLLSGVKAPSGLAVDATRVFCASSSGIQMLDRATAKATSITVAPTSEVAIDGDTVLGCAFADAAGVLRRYELVASASGSIMAKDVIRCESFVATSTEVYFGGDHHDRAMSEGSKEADVLAEPPARRVVLDDTWVYSISYDSSSVLRVRRTTGELTTIAQSPSPNGGGDIAIDATHVYWTTGRPNGGVYRAPKEGGPVETIAQALSSPLGIAVDDVAVYWTEQSAGRLRKRAK